MKKAKVISKIIAWVLCLCMMVPNLSTTVLAAESASTEAVSVMDEKQETKETDSTTEAVLKEQGEELTAVTEAEEEAPEATEEPESTEAPEKMPVPTSEATEMPEEIPESTSEATEVPEEVPTPEVTGKLEEIPTPGITISPDVEESASPSETPDGLLEQEAQETATPEMATPSAALDFMEIIGTDTSTEELAEISNITVEQIGYQYAKVVVDITFSEDVTVNKYSLCGGVKCSDDTLSTASVQRLYRYQDENNNYIENRYYLKVKLCPGSTLSYTPFVQVTDSTGTDQIVSAQDSIEITGKSFANMNPTLRFDSGITVAILFLDVQDYNYNLDGVLSTSIYYRKKGEDTWRSYSGSTSFSNSVIKIEASGLSAGCEYEVYAEIKDSNGSDIVVSSNVCSFTTEEDQVYSSEQFPDEVFYAYILKRCGGEQITQSKLNQIYGFEIYSDTLESDIPIKSIEGIQYLKNLQNVTIEGHDIEDASPISELKFLEAIDFDSNELKDIPDMSGMSNLKSISFNYNKIPESKIVTSRLPENSSVQNSGNWSKLAQYQLNDSITITVPFVCYGWGESQPIVLGIDSLKGIDYTIKLFVADKTCEAIINGYNAYSSYRTYGYLPYVIPNTGLEPGSYDDVKVEIYDCYGRKQFATEIDVTLVEDSSTISTGEVGVKSTYFSIDGELLGTSQKISSIKLIKENELYGETTYVSSYPILNDEERYVDFFYGNTYGADIDYDDFECERNAIKFLGTISISQALSAGDYDLEFSLADGTVVTEKNAIHINSEPRVYSVGTGSESNGYKYIYDNSGEYIYVIVRGYQLDTEKVWPEIYLGSTILTEYDGIELKEETDEVGMGYYVYRLKKLEVDTYWKESQSFRWRLRTQEDYVCNDLATTHGFSYSYNSSGIEIGLFWVDDHFTEDTCKIYVKSSLPDNTLVKVTAYEAPSYSEFKASGTGILKDGKIVIDFYDTSGELYYPKYNRNCFIYEFQNGESVITIKGQPTVYSFTGTSTSGTKASYNESGINIVVYGDTDKQIYHGIQWGIEAEYSYDINVYLPNSTEKVLSLNLTQSNIGECNAHFFTQNDIKNLDPEQVYRIDVMDKSGARLLKRFYGYLTSKVEESVVYPTAITLSQKSATLSKDDTLQLTATITPSNANTSRTWTSSNTSVATVSSSGLVTAVGVGTADITVTTVNGKTAKCTITVVDYQISDTSVKLNVGDTKELSILNGDSTVKATWTTSNSAVAAVDSSTGKVTARGKGSAVITGTITDGLTFTCDVEVVNELKEIKIQTASEILEVGDEETLKLIFVPASEESSSTVTWTSSNGDVATVDENGTVKAVGAGKVTITASAVSEGSENVCTAQWTYTVCESDKAEAVPEDFYLHAVTNVDTTLADIPGELPDKWQWVDGSTKLADFAGLQEKDFAVVHTNKNTGEVQYDTVTVKLSTISGIILLGSDGEAIASKLATGNEETKVKAEYAVLGEALGDREEGLNLTWSFALAPKAKSGIANYSIDKETGEGSLSGLQAGSTTLALTLSTNGKTLYTIQQKLTVVDSGKKGIAKIQITLIDEAGNEIQANEEGVYVLQKGATVYLKDSTEKKADGKSYKISYKTSDSGVVKTGKADKTDATKTPLTLAKAGTAVITVAADDTLKSTKEVVVKVEDRTAAGVHLSQTSVTINTAMKEKTAEVSVYNGYGGKLTSAVLEGINGTKVDSVEADGTVILQGSGAGKGTLTVTFEGMEEPVALSLTVKTTKKQPSVSIKQVTKLNTFYQDAEAVFTVGAAGEQVTDVTVKGMTKGTDFSYDAATGTLTLKKATAKKHDFVVSFADYDAITKQVSVGTEKESFKLSSTSGTVYTDSSEQVLSLNLVDKRTGLAVDLTEVSVSVKVVSGSGKYQVETKGNTLLLTTETAPAKKGDKLTLTFTSADWKEAVNLTFTVKAAQLSKASLQLGQKSLTLYNYKGMSASTSTTLTLKGGSPVTDLLSKVAIVEVQGKNMPLALDKTLKVTYQDGEIKVAKNGEDLKAGTYKFNLELTDGALKKPLKATLTVKVVDVDMKSEKSSAKVKTTAKGTIDVLNREGTGITLTPKFTNVAKDAKVTDISLTGKDAHLFEITERSGNNVTVHLKNEANVITKYKYSIAAVYKVQAGDTCLTLTSSTISVKLTQKKPKVKAAGAGTYSSTVEEGKNLSFIISNSAGVKIDTAKAELLNYTKDFSYDEESGTLTHKLNGETARGKSYTLKFAVYPEGCGDNEKPVTVTYKVTIAK